MLIPAVYNFMPCLTSDAVFSVTSYEVLKSAYSESDLVRVNYFEGPSSRFVYQEPSGSMKCTMCTLTFLLVLLSDGRHIYPRI